MPLNFPSLSRVIPSRSSDPFDIEDFDIEDMYTEFDNEQDDAELSRQPQLADRLFDEYDRRYATAMQAKASLEFFDNKLAIIFSSSHGEAGKLADMLEDFFGLGVLQVHEPTFYYEWLYRYAGVTDLILLDVGSFSDKNVLSRFLTIVREVNEEVPVLAIGEGIEKNGDKDGISVNCDISLASPVTLDDLCRG
ncbi:hypothetical protein, partial [Roseovarius sp.]